MKLLLALCALTLAVDAAEPAPTLDFTLPDLNGQNRSLAEFRGQWVVVNYWATWCTPCIKEIPELQALDDARADVTVVGVLYEDIEAERARRFVERLKATYPMLAVDVYAPADGIETPKGLPLTQLVDPSGVKRDTIYGPVTRASLEEQIARLALELDQAP